MPKIFLCLNFLCLNISMSKYFLSNTKPKNSISKKCLSLSHRQVVPTCRDLLPPPSLPIALSLLSRESSYSTASSLPSLPPALLLPLWKYSATSSSPTSSSSCRPAAAAHNNKNEREAGGGALPWRRTDARRGAADGERRTASGGRRAADVERRTDGEVQRANGERRAENRAACRRGFAPNARPR